MTFSNNATASVAGIEAAYLNAGTAIIQVLSNADVTNSGALESPMNSGSLVLAGITVE